LYVGLDGRTALLTRSADLRQAHLTSNIADVRIWKDSHSAEPARDLVTMLDSLNCRGKRLGLETDTHGLTYGQGLKVAEATEGFADIIDASLLIPHLRATKSAAEINFVKRAAALSDAADRAAIAALGPGVDEADILAAQHDTIFRGGGD